MRFYMTSKFSFHQLPLCPLYFAKPETLCNATVPPEGTAFSIAPHSHSGLSFILWKYSTALPQDGHLHMHAGMLCSFYYYAHVYISMYSLLAMLGLMQYNIFTVCNSTYNRNFTFNIIFILFIAAPNLHLHRNQ